MRQDTDDLWAVRKDLPFTEEQFNRIRAQYQARQHGVKWENFERQWQGGTLPGRRTNPRPGRVGSAPGSATDRARGFHHLPNPDELRMP